MKNTLVRTKNAISSTVQLNDCLDNFIVPHLSFTPTYSKHETVTSTVFEIHDLIDRRLVFKLWCVISCRRDRVSGIRYRLVFHVLCIRECAWKCGTFKSSKPNKAISSQFMIYVRRSHDWYSCATSTNAEYIRRCMYHNRSFISSCISFVETGQIKTSNPSPLNWSLKWRRKNLRESFSELKNLWEFTEDPFKISTSQNRYYGFHDCFTYA